MDEQTSLLDLDALPSVEEKIRASIEKMEAAIARSGKPDFKVFWDARKYCLPLFKEQLSGPVRSAFWEKFIELTREGRRLKELLDQETAFAVDQIELAIKGLKEEVELYKEDREKALATAPELVLETIPKAVQRSIERYTSLQRHLNLLNLFAARVHALRKELVKTEMRVRQKNNFFQTLSLIGDDIFPPRKELIKQVGDQFSRDVHRFAEQHFSDAAFLPEKMRRSVFFFRDEIKALQAMAKQLTLNAETFAAIRIELSTCWDKLKGMEKELRKEFAEQKSQSHEKRAEIQKKIEAFKENYATGSPSLEEGYEALAAIEKQMREVTLVRADVVALKEALKVAAEPLDAKRDEAQEAHRQALLEEQKARQAKFEAFREELEALRAAVEGTSVEALLSQLDEKRQELGAIGANKREKEPFEQQIRAIREAIKQKQERALLSLSAGDRAALESLEQLLVERRSERKEIKAQMEVYRKTQGGSALDFEKALAIGEKIEKEKARLAAVDEVIGDLEQKLNQLKIS